jgi:hypothetical protein
MVVKKSTNTKTKTTGNNIGRPTKLTPATKNKLLSMIKMGSPLESACKACRLDYNTVRDWINRGKNTHPSRPPTPEYVDFAVDFEQALSEGESLLISYIHVAAKSKDWKAAAWLLSRRNPHQWGERKLNSLEDIAVLLAGYGVLPKEKIEQLLSLSDAAKDEMKRLLNNETLGDSDDKQS